MLNFVGALFFQGVAQSIAGKIVDVHAFHVTMLMSLCGLLGASGWSFCMARFGLPISTSHSLIGGLVGVVPHRRRRPAPEYLVCRHYRLLDDSWRRSSAFLSAGLLMWSLMWTLRNVAPVQDQSPLSRLANLFLRADGLLAWRQRCAESHGHHHAGAGRWPNYPPWHAACEYRRGWAA